MVKQPMETPGPSINGGLILTDAIRNELMDVTEQVIDIQKTLQMIAKNDPASNKPMSRELLKAAERYEGRQFDEQLLSKAEHAMKYLTEGADFLHIDAALLPDYLTACREKAYQYGTVLKNKWMHAQRIVEGAQKRLDTLNGIISSITGKEEYQAVDARQQLQHLHRDMEPSNQESPQSRLKDAFAQVKQHIDSFSTGNAHFDTALYALSHAALREIVELQYSAGFVSSAYEPAFSRAFDKAASLSEQIGRQDVISLRDMHATFKNYSRLAEKKYQSWTDKSDMVKVLQSLTATSLAYCDARNTGHDLRVLMVEPMKEPYEAFIRSDLESLQYAVGGSIECLKPNEETVMVCNLERNIYRSNPNRLLNSETITGTFFVASDSGEDFSSMSDQQLQASAKRFERALTAPRAALEEQRVNIGM